jgi:hypothetical protein
LDLKRDLAYLEDYGVGIQVRVKEKMTVEPAKVEMHSNTWQAAESDNPNTPIEKQKRGDVFSVGLLLFYLVTLERLQESPLETVELHFKKGFLMDIIKKCVYSKENLELLSVLKIIFPVVEKFEKSNISNPKMRFFWAYEESVWDMIMDWKKISITLNR